VEVLEQFEQHFQHTFPQMRQLIAIRAGQQQWPGTPIADFFRDYLAEVQQIVAVIDLFPSHVSSTHG
jgi:hypothetical protein